MINCRIHLPLATARALVTFGCLFASAGFGGGASPLRAAPLDISSAAEQLARAPAGLLRIDSPEVAQTYSFSVTTRYVLHWDRRAQLLSAYLSFSNSPQQTNSNNRVEEQFRFPLPGVSFDPATGVFSARDAQGRSAPVAVRVRGGGGFFSLHNAIEPSAGATIYVSKDEGRVKVALTADPAGTAVADQSPRHWIIDGIKGLF